MKTVELKLDKPAMPEEVPTPLSAVARMVQRGASSQVPRKQKSVAELIAEKKGAR